jgi:hypothetical protein
MEGLDAGRVWGGCGFGGEKAVKNEVGRGLHGGDEIMGAATAYGFLFCPV